jgi:hypothetical protein
LNDIDLLLRKYAKAGDEYPAAKAKRVYLEEYKKSLIALLMKDAERKGSNSVSGQERDALCRQEFLDHLLSLERAVESDERLRLEIKRIEMEIEIWRTNQATERLERKTFGG